MDQELSIIAGFEDDVWSRHILARAIERTVILGISHL